MPVPVLIVGAGPTGLTLALWLTKLGVAVRVVDAAEGPGTTSRALAVQARTLEFHRQVGLAEAVVADGVRVAGVNLWVSGRRAARLPLGDVGQGTTRYPFALIYPQDAHERLLVEHLAALGVTVERRTTLVGLAQTADGVQATLLGPAGETSVCRAAYLAGCDGARSAVRRGLGTAFAGGTYDTRFFVADVVASGPAADGEIHVDLDRSEFLAIFPLRGPSRVRLVGTAPAGVEPPSFAQVATEPLRTLGMTVEAVNWFSTYRAHHRVAARFRQGRAFLLGDAAHIHSPVGGQGMNTGIGDAANLAWKLAAVLKGEATDALLDSYEPERIGFARRLVATTDRAFTLVSAGGPFAQQVRTQVVPRVAPRLFRSAGARRRVFGAVSQLGVSYRTSPLSRGRAGAVRGGDRLPWLSSAGGDNHEHLSSLRWQVHVYGEAAPGLAAACEALGLPLHTFGWSDAAGEAGLAEGAVYLVRPDGYVALADRSGRPGALQQYMAEHGLRSTSPA